MNEKYVVTKTWNDLKPPTAVQPPKTTYNHLNPSTTTYNVQPSTTTYNHLMKKSTTTYNHLKNIYNHLQPPQNIYNHSQRIEYHLKQAIIV